MRDFLAIFLRRGGHQVTVASEATEALVKLREKPFDLVVTDLRMPGELDGLGILKAIKAGEVQRASGPVDPEVIVMTAYATADTALSAMKQGAYDYLTKPFKLDEIEVVITRALEKRALVAENLTLRDRVAGRARLAALVGKSRAMQQVFELIGKIHSTKTSVLITGES